MSPTIFVTGATGNQGGELVKQLLNLDPSTTIHALVRNPDSSAAQKLVALSPNNIKIFKGDFDDVSAIGAAASGCTGAFLNVTPVFTDPTGEVRHAQNLVAECTASKTMTRIVYSSSAAMHQPPDSTLYTEYVPNNPNTWMSSYVKSKKACEDSVTSSDLKHGWCIIRGNSFFSNFLAPFSKFMYPDLDTKQTITTAFSPDLKLSYLDPGDLGILAARALLSDQEQWDVKFKGKCIPVGKQNLTLDQVVESMNQTLSGVGVEKQIRLIYIPEDEAKKRAAEGDMIIDSQLFGQAYPNVTTVEESKAFGLDLDAMVGVDEFFQRESNAVVAAVGGR